MIDGYKCPNGHQFDIEREGDRASESVHCPQCEEQAVRKFEFNIAKHLGRRRNVSGGTFTGNTVALYAHDGPPSKPRSSAFHVGPGGPPAGVRIAGNIGGDNRFFIKGDDTVDGLTIDEGHKVQLDELYVEGGVTSVDNAGELDAPDSEIG